MGFLYQIENRLNGKCYIGKTEKSVAWRFKKHKLDAASGSSCPLHRAMRKHGVDNFTVTELLSFENEHLSALEKGFIGIYQTRGKGYNATPGGEGLSSERTKAALAAAKARGTPLGGRRVSAERFAEIGAAARQARTEKADKRAAELLPVIRGLQTAGARTLRQIAAGLNEKNITTPRGGEWSAVQVQRALTAARWHGVNQELRGVAHS